MLNLDRASNDTSLLLDFLRAIAAQLVCIGHGLSFFGVAIWTTPPNFPYMQNVGVLLFFIMSGFLITATLKRNSTKPGYRFGRYFIDRFARIYSGLIPALIFIIVVDLITQRLTLDPEIARYYDLQTLLANVVMLEDYKGVFSSRLQWSAFGSAGPLWTLAVEWHIYMFVGAAFFIAKGSWRSLWLIPIALFFGQTPIHYLFGALQSDGVGSGLFSLWLAGAAVYVFVQRYLPPLWVSTMALATATLTFCLMIAPGHEYRMATYPALVVAFGSLVCVTQRTNVIGGEKFIKIAADYSFTLYLIHYTVMTAIHLIFKEGGTVIFMAAVLISNVAAAGLAEVGEKRQLLFKNFFLATPSIVR